MRRNPLVRAATTIAIFLISQVVLGGILIAVSMKVFDPAWAGRFLVDPLFGSGQEPEIVLRYTRGIVEALRYEVLKGFALGSGCALAWGFIAELIRPMGPRQMAGLQGFWRFLFAVAFFGAAGEAWYSTFFHRISTFNEDYRLVASLVIVGISVCAYYPFGTLMFTRLPVRKAVPLAHLFHLN